MEACMRYNSGTVEEEPDPILDLTCLLVTGRASESLVDFLGSGEQMSERVYFRIFNRCDI
jgi:hypothetical protein